MMIVEHLPALQVLVPFMGALLSILAPGRLAYYIALAAGITGLVLGYFLLNSDFVSISYAFGDWKPPLGIEYRLDRMNEPVIFYINAALVFMLLFNRSLIDSTVLSFISAKRQQLFYAILLFAHAGFVGILSTNDIFNLYVFIEISSLSAYVLISTGNNPRAAIGAFDYLILGTIGATLILIGIGFLLAVTGSLNMTDIKNLSAGAHHLKTIRAAAGFLIVGCLLKLAFFPMHFWMIRAYNNAPIAVLIYLAAISGATGCYMLIKICDGVLGYDHLTGVMSLFLYPLSMLTMILCAIFALNARDAREVIVFAAAGQIGYILLMFSQQANWELLLKFLIFDGAGKIALFLIVGNLEGNELRSHYDCTTGRGDDGKAHNPVNFTILSAINLICSAGLPIGGMFLVKLTILQTLISRGLWLGLFSILIASSLAFLYHYKLARYIFFAEGRKPMLKGYGLAAITLVQLILPWVIL